MKLFLAVAVLLLAFAAHTGAQEAEPEPEPEPETVLTVEKRLADFGAQVTEFSSNLADKTKEAFEKIHTSETATSVRNWFSDTFNKVKTSFENSK